MEIRELLLRNFGKFTEKRILLDQGINLLYGENESGKSTIHTFIKGMLFGIERGRGRASVNDTYSRYEPWENPNYYSGKMRFISGGKIFSIDRNFDKYSKKAELICEDDGEKLSVTDGDLEELLGGLNSMNYDNTVSVGQMKTEPGNTLASELKNYATNYYATGDSDINLTGALENLKNKKKLLDQEVRNSLNKKQHKKENIEQEASYVWREIHRLEEEKKKILEMLENQKAKKEQEELKKGINEIRPSKWRIHPIEIISFILIVILTFVFISKPWNYPVSIVIFLACGLYVWNRMKVSKKQEKTPSEILLEEIMSKEENVSVEKLIWEEEHVNGELREKQIQYGNLKEQLMELDEVSEEYWAYDKRRTAIQIAMEKLNELSDEMQKQLKERLNDRASDIIQYITDGKYSRLLIEEGLHMNLLEGKQRISMEQLSRGTVEQIYFALRMAAIDLLHEEDNPVILDDTFVYYDEKRLKRTLQWLYENKKQVIIFTCQTREENLLKESGIPYRKEEL